MSPDPQLVVLAKQTAAKYQLEPDLICAICEQESSWDTYSIRYEPEFQRRYIAPLDLDPTSSMARSTSWGLMQVMGQSAREVGFPGPFPQLCLSEIGIDIGCKLFLLKLGHAGGNVHDALQFYNGGGNPNYAAEVLARLPNYKETK